MAITKEQAIDILDKFDFFEGQRAGRELWNDKPYEVQEEDIETFSRDVAELKAYIADVAPKSEVDRAYERGFERGKKDNVCGFSAEEIAQKAENIAIELEAMRTAANSYKMHYENARVEVAREIFEEIEKIIASHGITIGLVFDEAEGASVAIGRIDRKITELKKKYTEGGE